MTLCLAALAQDKIVIVADTMVSVDHYQYDAAVSKFYIHPQAGILIADDLSLHSEMLAAVRSYLMPSETEIDRVHICDIANRYNELVNEIYFGRERCKLLQRYYGLTTKTYLTEPMSEMLARQIEDNLRTIPPPPLEAIIVGYDERDRPHIYKYSEGKMKHENLNRFAAIGAGWELAEHRLLELRYNSGAPLSDALFHCYDAKRYSETIVGVGQTTRLFYMRPPNSYCAIHHRMDNLEALYQKMRSEHIAVNTKIREEWYETLKQSNDLKDA